MLWMKSSIVLDILIYIYLYELLIFCLQNSISFQIFSNRELSNLSCHTTNHSQHTKTNSEFESPSDNLNLYAQPPTPTDSTISPLHPRKLKYRIGHGYDIHQLSKNSAKPLVIAGLVIPGSVGVISHSDGDVVLHSICDSIFGSLSLPDIGQQFPDSDSKWNGANSEYFIKIATNQLENHGYRIMNIDITVILQRPKLSNYKESMQQKLSKLLSVDKSCVNIKFRTHENVDAVGSGLAIECHVVALFESFKDL